MNKDNTKQIRNAVKEYVIYIPTAENNENGGFFDVLNDGVVNLVSKIGCASKLTSVEANRVLSKYISDKGIIPFKLKVCDYKNYSFIN